MQIYKVLMFGDRNWGLVPPVLREIRRLKRKAANRNAELVIICGGAPGADQLSKVLGHMENVHAVEVAALWDTRGRGAGPQRNKVMELLGPAEGVCFHPDLCKSKGSANMKRLLDRAGVPVKVVAK